MEVTYCCKQNNICVHICEAQHQLLEQSAVNVEVQCQRIFNTGLTRITQALCAFEISVSHSNIGKGRFSYNMQYSHISNGQRTHCFTYRAIPRKRDSELAAKGIAWSVEVSMSPQKPISREGVQAALQKDQMNQLAPTV